MNIIAVTAFAASVDKASLFQVGNQLSHFARHFSIKKVSRCLAVVNPLLAVIATTTVSSTRLLPLRLLYPDCRYVDSRTYISNLLYEK